MAWEDLCGGAVVDGKAIDLRTLVGAGVEHDKRGKSGLPEAAVLGKLLAAADRLDIKDPPTKRAKGISFTVAQATIGRDGNVSASEKFNEFVNTKRGAGVCYEDSFLPLGTVGLGHVLVHQSVAPCKRCRSGYKQWAMQRRSTIVVSADDGYDGAPDNTTFVFAPTGLVLYG